MSGPRLSIIPAGAIFDRALEPRDLQVLGLLGCHTDKAGWCRRSQVKMAAELDCSRSSVQRSLDRLCEVGWVQKKRAAWSNQEGQPSNSYEYRVVLDRDDEAEAVTVSDQPEPGTDQSYASDAIETDAAEATECPPLGIPPAQLDGHPGAQPCVGTGAHTYVGTKNDPLERPLVERERDARARERTARFLIDFEKRWPSKVDDRQRTAYAAEALSPEEQEAALAGIAAFLDNAKRVKRSSVPAGWKYLENKNWQLLDQPKPGTVNSPGGYPRNSAEGKAIILLHEIAGKTDALWKIYIRDDVVYYRKPMTPRLLALGTAEVPAKDKWVALNHQQAGAWEAMLRETITIEVRRPLRAGDAAPWPWPPSAEGKIYATGPPETLMSEQDMADFK